MSTQQTLNQNRADKALAYADTAQSSDLNNRAHDIVVREALVSISLSLAVIAREMAKQQ